MPPENKKDITCPFWGECEEGIYCTSLELKNSKLCSKYWKILLSKKDGLEKAESEVKKVVLFN